MAAHKIKICYNPQHPTEAVTARIIQSESKSPHRYYVSKTSSGLKLAKPSLIIYGGKRVIAGELVGSIRRGLERDAYSSIFLETYHYNAKAYLATKNALADKYNDLLINFEANDVVGYDAKCDFSDMKVLRNEEHVAIPVVTVNNMIIEVINDYDGTHFQNNLKMADSLLDMAREAQISLCDQCSNVIPGRERSCNICGKTGLRILDKSKVFDSNIITGHARSEFEIDTRPLPTYRAGNRCISDSLLSLIVATVDKRLAYYMRFYGDYDEYLLACYMHARNPVNKAYLANALLKIKDDEDVPDAIKKGLNRGASDDLRTNMKVTLGKLCGRGTILYNNGVTFVKASTPISSRLNPFHERLCGLLISDQAPSYGAISHYMSLVRSGLRWFFVNDMSTFVYEVKTFTPYRVTNRLGFAEDRVKIFLISKDVRDYGIVGYMIGPRRYGDEGPIYPKRWEIECESDAGRNIILKYEAKGPSVVFRHNSRRLAN